MADCTFGYPVVTDFESAAKNVVNYIRGVGGVSTACAVHCGWVCQGYVQGMMLPCDGSHPVMTVAPGALQCKTDRDVADCLEKACSHPQGFQASGFDWQSLLTILIPLILEWLKPRPTP